MFLFYRIVYGCVALYIHTYQCVLIMCIVAFMVWSLPMNSMKCVYLEYVAQKDGSIALSCVFPMLLLTLKSPGGYWLWDSVLKSHVRERKGVVPSVLPERPVTFSVLSLCPVFGPMLHINMLGHIISCMWSFTGDLTGAVCTSCVCVVRTVVRETERARERESVCVCSKWMPYTHSGWEHSEGGNLILSLTSL